MNSIGSSSGPSVGGAGPSMGAGDNSNASDQVTHARGRIDDMTRHLGLIRDRLTEENLSDEIAKALDDADEHIEFMADQLLSSDL
jgi:hypothetical protein